MCSSLTMMDPSYAHDRSPDHVGGAVKYQLSNSVGESEGSRGAIRRRVSAAMVLPSTSLPLPPESSPSTPHTRGWPGSGRVQTWRRAVAVGRNRWMPAEVLTWTSCVQPSIPEEKSVLKLLVPEAPGEKSERRSTRIATRDFLLNADPELNGGLVHRPAEDGETAPLARCKHS